MQKEVEETGFLYASASSFCKTCQTRHTWTHLAVSMQFKQGKHKCWKQFPMIFLTCIQSEFKEDLHVFGVVKLLCMSGAKPLHSARSAT